MFFISIIFYIDNIERKINIGGCEFNERQTTTRFSNGKVHSL